MFSFTFTLVSGTTDRFVVGATSWGSWGDWSYCEDGHFINGYRLKIEDSQGGWDGNSNPNDDTAMNGIQFVCDNEDYRSVTNARTSKVGSWGSWGSWHICPENSFITGIRFFSEPAGPGTGVKDYDDTAANNMHVRCFGGNSIDQWVKNFVNEDASDRLYGWGDDMTDKYCKEGNAVSGFRTKVSDNQGTKDNDDTALNQLEVECTESPQCVRIEITNVKPKTEVLLGPGEPDAIFLDLINKCDKGTDSTWSHTTTTSKTKQVSETYSNTKSWSDTFGYSFKESIAVKLTAGIEIEKVFKVGSEVTTSFEATQEWTSTTSASETSVTGTVDIETLEASKTFTDTVPGFTKYAYYVTYEEYVGTVPYEAEAICYNNADVEISRKTIEGEWTGTAVSEYSMTTENLSDQCENRHVCECAMMSSSTGIGGTVCGSTLLLPGRDTWCYVFRDACDEGCTSNCPADGEGTTGELNTIIDMGLSPFMFEWSSKPCLDTTRRRGDDVSERLLFTEEN